MFRSANAFSIANMKKTHSSFSSHPHWPYDWSKIPLNNGNFQSAVNLWFDDEANAIATYGHIKDWNVTGVTTMVQAFKDRTTFNEDISGWDVSNVKSMQGMLSGARKFDQQIRDWNTTKVTGIVTCLIGPHSINRSVIGASSSSHRHGRYVSRSLFQPTDRRLEH